MAKQIDFKFDLGDGTIESSATSPTVIVLTFKDAGAINTVVLNLTSIVQVQTLQQQLTDFINETKKLLS